MDARPLVRFGQFFFMGVAATIASEVMHARNRGVPSFIGLDISGEFGDGALPTLRILLLGDSTVTAPGLADPDASWPRLIAARLADRYRVELVCLAEGGSRSADVLERQLSRAQAASWDIAILSVGSNDVLHLVPVWRFARNLDAIVSGLGSVADQVILFGVGDLGSIPRLPFPLNKLASLAGHVADHVHRRVAARRRVAKVDQWRLTTAAFNSGRHMFADDLFHASALGHEAWADALLPTVEEALGRLRRRRDPA